VVVPVLLRMLWRRTHRGGTLLRGGPCAWRHRLPGACRQLGCGPW